MYRHCIFCARDLGANEALEEFPVGRRLSFDPERGRLWVICPTCERWNLTPLDQRWEALEECERLFRDARLRVSSENVGLARVAGDLDLVRIGDPLRPEMAAWRYGDQFGRRRRRAFLLGGAGTLAFWGVATGSAGLLGGSMIFLPLHLIQLGRLALVRPLSIPTQSGRTLRVNPEKAGLARLRPTGEGWHLEVPHADGRSILEGPEAVEALGTLLPRVNRTGARSTTVQQAVRELESAGSAEAYFREAELRARKLGWGYNVLQNLPAHLRLALEMGAHESQEVAAAQGELAQLEARWREAEEIAAIADDLALPDWVRASLARLKRQAAGDDDRGTEGHEPGNDDRG